MTKWTDPPKPKGKISDLDGTTKKVLWAVFLDYTKQIHCIFPNLGLGAESTIEALEELLEAGFIRIGQNKEILYLLVWTGSNYKRV